METLASRPLTARQQLLIEAISNIEDWQKQAIVIQMVVRLIEAGETPLRDRPQVGWVKAMAHYMDGWLDDPLEETLDYMY